jgi:hypothetical protein
MMPKVWEGFEILNVILLLLASDDYVVDVGGDIPV